MMAEIKADRLLISSIQSYPCLTQINSEGYYVSYVIDNAWSKIAEDTGKSVDDCKSRFLALVEKFMIEKAKFSDNPAMASAMARQSWGLYHHMSLLQKHIQRRNSTYFTVGEDGKLTATKSGPRTSGLYEGDEKYRLTACDAFLETMKTTSPASESSEALEQTIDINAITNRLATDDLFGRFVAAELNEITDPVKKRKIKLQIVSLLLDDDAQ